MDESSLDRHSPKNSTGIMTAAENCRLVVEDEAIFTGKTLTEIDLKDRVIRKTWKLSGFSYSRIYEIDNDLTVLVKDKSTILEGYNITSFGVYIASRGRKIRISSSDDLNEARLIQSQITEFLKESAGRCPVTMNATACGA